MHNVTVVYNFIRLNRHNIFRYRFTIHAKPNLCPQINILICYLRFAISHLSINNFICGRTLTESVWGDSTTLPPNNNLKSNSSVLIRKVLLPVYLRGTS